MDLKGDDGDAAGDGHHCHQTHAIWGLHDQTLSLSLSLSILYNYWIMIIFWSGEENIKRKRGEREIDTLGKKKRKKTAGKDKWLLKREERGTEKERGESEREEGYL